MAIVNGIDVDVLMNAIGGVKEDPELGKRTFQVETNWLSGTRSESKVREFTVVADEPTELGGTDTAPNPVEITLAALGSCLATGFSANAAAMGIEIESMRLVVEGNLDLRGFFGLSEEVRPGFQSIQYTTYIKSNAPKEKLEALRNHVEKTSPCGDICANQLGKFSSEVVFE